MRRNPGFTLVELLVVIAIIAVLALVTYNPERLSRTREAARKATCLANCQRIALAALMYAQDYDEVLPACVADDGQGTAHAVGGVYTNRTWDQLTRDVTSKYGEEYLDGRWMWQLADLLIPYTKSKDVFNCPTLMRRDPRFGIETYVIGTGTRYGQTGSDDPLLDLVAGARKRKTTKVRQSGSYIYMCAHHPRSAAAKAGRYGADFRTCPGIPLLALWDVAQFLGYVGKPGARDAANPQDYLACSTALSAFDEPTQEPLAACNSFGVHEGYASDYVRDHVRPVELGGDAPTIPVAAPMAFVDGHAKYVRATFYQMLALIVSPNRSELARVEERTPVHRPGPPRPRPGEGARGGAR
ncbi:MAG: prepilin-type N-terminal cleavage/methylation domain-containing protein [Armatimonadota bacterium]|nr:MAG: prepilin-type N-terminal cleavage/methylation domain-containing protein [Armatimonadota bacterium]